MMATRFTIPLHEIDDCFRGAVPSTIGSVALDGTPNCTILSIVHRLDDEHIGLSRQFFNKTIANMLANPRIQLAVIHPDTADVFRLDALYERTETEGPLFDQVAARLDAVASQTGMSKVFKLAAVDICRVLECMPVPPAPEAPARARTHVDMAKVDAMSRKIATATTMDELVTLSLDALQEHFGYEHTIVLFTDEVGERLYTVASKGYEQSGAGSEVRVGDGIIGIAAARRQPVCLSNLPSDVRYTHAVRAGVTLAGGEADLEREIELPGLPNAMSEFVVPILARDRLLGVICLQDERPARFRADDEAIVGMAARQIGLMMTLLSAEAADETRIAPQPAAKATTEVPRAAKAEVKRYVADDSVFVDNEYLIKGVAGRVLWRLLQTYTAERRTDFTNKEMRLDPALDLPDIKDNLEARLVLLRRRLEDRCDFLRITTTGRGRFHLNVEREIALRQVGG